MRPHPLTFSLLLALIPAFAQAEFPSPAGGARIVPVAADAWAGSSVNVTANESCSLYTDGETQYAAFYDAASHLILAKRTLGSDQWMTQDTGYTGNAADAHNTIALIVDGKGVLHVSWNQHSGPLHYAKSTAPGSLDLGPALSMTGGLEDSVTYPMFFRLPSGDLLFLYRAGRSGQGDVVLKRYDTASGVWSLLQTNLISGEERRSAYVAASLDPKGTLHLAWTWRETPDVATNHDLCYARSTDGGASWTDSTGKSYTLPITAATAEYAATIPQGSSLMNPPSVGAGWRGVPAIADYWADANGVPQWHVLTPQGGVWRDIQATSRTETFSLSGTATRRPPLSRASILVESRWEREGDAVTLVYRDDTQGGLAVALSCADVSKPQWTSRALTASGLDAWEPSFDPVQWLNLNQLQMLVEKVRQPDGSDAAPASGGEDLGLLIWSPMLAAWMERPAVAQPQTDLAALDAPLSREAILPLLEKCADWQLAHPASYDPKGWEVAPFYLGVMALAGVSPAPRFKEAMLRQFEENEWNPGSRVYDADDQCVIQAYLAMWELEKKPEMIEASRAQLDQVLAKVPEGSLSFGTEGSRERWSWCDSLFMAPAAWAGMSKATDDSRYLRYMEKEWWAATDFLFQPQDGFYLRDNRFRDLREPDGRRIYWSRGNGWVVAGLCRVLDLLPEDYPTRLRYVVLYRRMMRAVLAAQQPDGLWTPGLLDPSAHAARETSGSAFYAYALAWGVNKGLLDRAATMPAIRRAWNALALSVTPEGRLINVQPVGDAPQGFDPEHSEPFGTGAFLLAGAEVWQACGWKGF